MPKTVLITGASSGIGQAAAELFLQNGWNVAATMRQPKAENEILLDVTRPETIRQAIETAIQKFGQIDVIVNNAGYGLVGPFEAADSAQIQKQYATNVFGLMAVIRAILPHFRARKAGIIINVSSMGGRVSFPNYSIYNSSKFAVEGFSEGLQFELEQFNIKVKLVEPGVIKTDFFGRSSDNISNPDLKDYQAFSRQVMQKMEFFQKTGSLPQKAAAEIYRAATDNSDRLRYPAGWDASSIALFRKILPDWLFRVIFKKIVAG